MTPRRLLGTLLCVLLLAGCNTVGPRAVRTARGAYNEAIIQTWNEQLLLNLVRLRYRDTPFFLEVSSVSTQHVLEGAASAVGRIGGGDNDVDSGVSGLYSESPTVTYLPMTGEDFLLQLLSPISLETLFLLPQAGWSIERVLRCCVQQMNDLLNAPSAAGPTPDYVPVYQDFHRAAHLLRQLQVDKALEMGIRTPAPASKPAEDDGGDDAKTPAGAEVPFVLRFAPEAAERPEVRELRELLGRRGEATQGDEYVFTFGTLDREPGELALYPRSLIGVMFYLSQAVEPPPAHLERGLVTRTRYPDGREFDWAELTGDMIRIRSGSDRPDEAFVAVPYRGAWFWIDDTDLNSKSTFGLLQQLFALLSGGTEGTAPLLTLPVGR